MATVQAYTKAGVDAKFNSRSNMTIVHTGGGTPDIAAFPDAKTGDIIERSGDGARWSVLARNLNPVEGRVVSVAGKSGIVTLTPSDVGAAPASHTHTVAQITDLTLATAATANTVVKRDSNGRITVATPSATSHATTKAYVDSAITGAKAWGNLTGKPSTFPPSAHTHTVSDITDLTLATAATANTTPLRDSAGRFAVANPSTAAQVANKGYVDSAVSSGTTWAKISGKPSTFTPSTHTHTKAQITDLNASTAAGANTIAQRDSAGRLTVVAPTQDTQAATKKYVDDTVTAGATWSSLAGKPSTFPPASHTHTVAQITGLTLDTAATASTVVQRDTSGRITVATPTSSAHAATKSYVDGRTGAPTWSSVTGKPTTFTPSAHTHTVSNITDLTLDASAVANTVPIRNSSGVFSVADPTSDSHPTNRGYVDAAVTAAKAWSAITGKPSTFKPSSHTHTQAQITGLPAKISAHDAATAKVNAAVSSVSGSSTDSGKLLVLTSTGRLGAVDPSGTTDVANKRYVDDQISAKTTWANTSGKPSTFPPSSHTHTKAQITDLNASTTATANSMAQRDSSGRLTVATPTSTTHATTKTYVDNAITNAKKWANLTGKPSVFTPSAHKHGKADITDLNAFTTATANSIAQRTSTGAINVATPTSSGHATPKTYVDSRPAVFSGPSVPPSSIPGAVKGDHWIDERNGNWYKITGV